LSRLAAAAEARVRRAGGTARRIELGPALDPDLLVKELVDAGVGCLFLLDGPDRALPVLRAADAAGWRPRFFLPGSLATPDVFEIPARVEPDVVFAFGSLLPLGARANLEEYRRLAAKESLPREHLQAQLTALASVAVLVEALKRAGRGVTRDSLIDQLEQFVDVPTGFSPNISFGPVRHIGASGAFIVGLRREARRFERLTGWIEPRDRADHVP
jgi:ABC-type branched-subunit amino acid transport system substrate-binding protein